MKFVDTAFLLIWGHLPSDEERAKLEHDLAHVPLPDKSVFDVIRSFSYVATHEKFQDTSTDMHIGRIARP